MGNIRLFLYFLVFVLCVITIFHLFPKQREGFELMPMNDILAVVPPDDKVVEIYPTDVLEIVNKIKEDLNLTPSISFYFSPMFQKTAISNNTITISVKSSETSKKDITSAEYVIYQLSYGDISADTLAKNIIKSYVAKQDMIVGVNRFYRSLLDNKSEELKLLAYNECADIISALRLKKSSINSRDDLKNEIEKLTTDQKATLKNAINKFNDTYLELDNDDNPLSKDKNIHYISYIDSIKVSNDFMYELAKPLYAKVDKYNNNDRFRKDVIAFLDIAEQNKVYFMQALFSAIKEDGSCFQDNIGEIEVEMRPCTLYFTEHSETCKDFGDLYKLSVMQLQMLIDKNSKAYPVLNYGGNNVIVYLYNPAFMEVIKQYKLKGLLNKISKDPKRWSKWNIQTLTNSLKKYLNIKQVRYDDIINKFCQNAWKDIFDIKVKYNNKEYNCYDMYVIIDKKIIDPSIQLCKIDMGKELREIHKIKGDDKIFNNKIYKETYPNKSELWGSCFYSVSSNDIENKVPQTIMQDYKKHYGLSTLCPEKPVINNIKCTSGCATNNENKFIPFHIEPVGNDISPFIMNPALHIDQNIVFMKIRVRYLNRQEYRFSVSFVKFNNQTKEFNAFVDNNWLNTHLRTYFYTIRDNGSLILSPNFAKRNIYVCNFYNNKAYEYTTKQYEFSLSSFGVPSIGLNTFSPYSSVYNQIYNRRSELRCNNPESLPEMIKCMNVIKDNINKNSINTLKSDIKSLENTRDSYQKNVDYYNTNITSLNNELQKQNTSLYYCNENNPIFPFHSFYLRIYLNAIKEQNRLKKIEDDYLKQLISEAYYFERNIDWRRKLVFENWYWSGKLSANRGRQEEIRGKSANIQKVIDMFTSYLNVFKTYCDNISSGRKSNELNLERNTGFKDYNEQIVSKYNSQISAKNTELKALEDGTSAKYLSNIETYHINSFDVFKNHIEVLVDKVINEYGMKYVNGDELYLSNDNSIYVQIT